MPPGSGGVRYSASVCPAGCRKRASGRFCGKGHLGCGRFERSPVVSPSGFGGNPARFAGRAKREEFYCSGHNPGRWAYGGGAVLEPIEHSVLEKPLDGGPMEGMSVCAPPPPP